MFFALNTPAAHSEVTECESDPLLSRMMGEWIGTGSRNWHFNNKKLSVEMRVHSVCTTTGLVSTNTITETPITPLGAPQIYTRTYWIQNGPTDSIYILGSGSVPGSSSSKSVGTLNKAEFGLELQTLELTNSGIEVRGATYFPSADQKIRYRESMSSQGHLVEEAEITFSQIVP